MPDDPMPDDPMPDDPMPDDLDLQSLPWGELAFAEEPRSTPARDIPRLLRRRRIVRRALLGLTGLGLFVLGFVAGRVVDPQDDRPADRPLPPPSTVQVAGLADDMEQLAAQVPLEQRASLLRQAGDRHLQEALDPLAALRCYQEQLALEARPGARDHESTASFGEESWLLLALKEASENP